jgi:hypothetical protein
MDDDGFHERVQRLTHEELFERYGPWQSMPPAEVAAELAGCGVRWWIAGGRAARAGASASRAHDDTDVAVLAADVEGVRAAMRGWHLWENINEELRPLLDGVPVRDRCEQLWVRRDAFSPWRMEFLVDRAGTAQERVYKRDPSVRLPWDRAEHTVDGLRYLRPEVALLYKAGRNEARDRDDLAAARLDDDARTWLTVALEETGQAEWAALARAGR